jgi:membrane-bound lytic murein transglycosylase A
MRLAALAAGLLAAACARMDQPAPGPLRPAAEPAPAVARAGWPAIDAQDRAALAAAIADFRRACPRLLARADMSGLTRPADWEPACADPATGDPARFLARHFAAVRLRDGEGLVTGYFEPLVAARRDPAPGLAPVLGPPPRGALPPGPGPTRAEIEAGALSGIAPVIAWADPVDLFFLQVQGSGVLGFPDGAAMPVGFAGDNGHPYVAIGRLLRARGALADGAGMAEIRAWLARHPAEGAALMRENPRFIFLAPRPPGAPGPIGSLGVALAPARAIAIDPAHAPLGALAFLETMVDGRPWRGLVLAADTGAAIRGPNRVDLFLGRGEGAVAGRLQSPGRLTLLLPHRAAARLAP